jgi:hypothetical protein
VIFVVFHTFPVSSARLSWIFLSGTQEEISIPACIRIINTGEDAVRKCSNKGKGERYSSKGKIKGQANCYKENDKYDQSGPPIFDFRVLSH